ncbi:methyl-accepting chemotaxis protein [Vibrio scophthalmi]|uniref:methyl-accepting chemotaxis protein n=1 Tax=Vibrio scophthalmi TaxID=45658 RepID=UPI002283E97B|nr:methyl-accepting chemotaxis protein [Vibrio scophthalmi]MCY9803860.1 methyl-accepting chemotaxis protein [Vibrio scophthalmi]
MFAFLRQFPLYVIVSWVAGIPLTIAIALATQDIFELNKQSSSALKDEQLVNLVVKYDDLAHNLALERGLTAGVLGSNGNPEIVENLKAQRKVVNIAMAELQPNKASLFHSDLNSALQKDVQEELSRIEAVRQGVDSLAPDIAPFGFYSHLNQLIIDNIDLLISETQSHELSALGKSLISVVIIKERAGQARGALNGVYAKGGTNAVTYTSIKDYIQSSDYALRSAKIIMPEAYLTQLTQLEQQQAWQSIEQIQEQFLAQANSLDAIQGPSATEWFPMATKRIGLINQLRNAIQTDMVQYATVVYNQSIFNRNLLIGATLLVSIIIASLVIALVQGLRARVGSMKAHLNLMSENHDLTYTLNHTGKDEISSIASSINKLIANLKQLLFEVTKTNDNNASRLDSIVQSSLELDNSSRSTIAKCDNIATAMTQLAQSSVEIAHSAERAMDDTNSMNKQVQLCQQQSRLSFNSVQSLMDQINATEQCLTELEVDTQSISQIVATISGVSEQTNLLALNAAIEAARAGDHGRGFAVVSSEVRDLAQRSQEATENISKLLAKITDKTRFSVENMTKSKQASDDTFESVKNVTESIATLESGIEQVNDHISTIAHSTIEQSKACEAIDKDVDILNEIAHQTSNQADALNEVVVGYKTEAKGLQDQLNQFKLA